MVAELRADTPIPSADTIRRELMECYRVEAARIGERLRSVDSKISLTLDCWTPSNGLAFLGVTAHSIDAQWTPHDLVLGFLPLHGAHTAENLCDELSDLCDRVETFPNLLCVTTDNASNLAKLLVGFEAVCSARNVAFNASEHHLRGVLHVLNLSVQTLLRELKAEAPDDDGADPDSSTGSCSNAAARGSQLSCLGRLRSATIKIRNSPQHRQEFHRQCEACGMPRKELLLDTRTRWNSTYTMLDRACELREPLSKMARLSPDLPELGDDEWDLVKVTTQLVVPWDAADAATTVWLSRLWFRSSAASWKSSHSCPPPVIPR